MNIVLVDDDALVCASLKTILEAGGEVRVAATGGSGAEAVALYRRTGRTCCSWTSAWPG